MLYILNLFMFPSGLTMFPSGLTRGSLKGEDDLTRSSGQARGRQWENSSSNGRALVYGYVICFGIFALLLFPLSLSAQLGISDTKHDSSQPIDIKSEELLLRPAENIAIFSGDVKALQGSLKMESEKMNVLYHDEKGRKKSGNSLSKIITSGGVILTIPGKRAKANNGVYDIDKEFVTLKGNVVLNRGANVLHGTLFTYDVATGRSKMGAGTSSKISEKTLSKKPQRVKGRFFPKRKTGSKPVITKKASGKIVSTQGNTKKKSGTTAKIMQSLQKKKRIPIPVKKPIQQE